MVGSIVKSPWLTLPLMMVLAGLLGGLVNYFLTNADDPSGRSIRKSLLMGVVASLMVPLFLYIVSSKILDNVTKDGLSVSDTFVFFGFCLVAAASSTAFIRTVSLRIVKELEEKFSNVRSDVDLMMTKETEKEPSTSMAFESLEPRLQEKEVRILQEMANGRFLLRTRTGVSRETGIDKPEVDRIISELAGKGLVGTKVIVNKAGQSKTRWFITEAGRDAIVSG